ncbi:hypothetical protein [Halalkalibacter sp. APA_J-10(15)]|uniref:hypothetical protein n=1 Tax=Halalkalibacter sp. APA_J-10(15) TaxID=2933805 RepID=UPI001FF5D77D|nr:hypothetical protein [Halalkalibacter sp. APA_J-10(15)]MCK0470894.1 hypothetical protein [Halalkalibacter sp. APA_J-10(15)]
MKDFALLAHYFHFDTDYIMQMPHAQYLSYIKQARVMELEKTEEGREYLDKAKRYLNPRKDADLSAIRKLSGYSASEKGGESS